MNHAITIGGLLLAILALGGLLAAAFGVLMIFAGGMSDAPNDGMGTSSTGCLVFLIGATRLGLGIWGLVA